MHLTVEIIWCWPFSGEYEVIDTLQRLHDFMGNVICDRLDARENWEILECYGFNDDMWNSLTQDDKNELLRQIGERNSL